VTWRLFYVYDFCHKIMSPGQPGRGVYRDSLFFVHFTFVYVTFSKLAKIERKFFVFCKKRKFCQHKINPGNCLGDEERSEQAKL
jgi:hypothetical protein